LWVGFPVVLQGLSSSVLLAIGVDFGQKFEEGVLQGFGGVSLQGNCAFLQQFDCCSSLIDCEGLQVDFGLLMTCRFNPRIFWVL